MLTGLDRDAHYGHALAGPRALTEDGPRLLAVGGGTKWDESRTGRDAKRDSLALFALTGGAGRPRVVIEGARGGERFAYDLAFAPGLLGDSGTADLAVGAPRGPVVERDGSAAALERGAVYVFSGAALDATEEGAVVAAGEAAVILVGRVGGERLGYSVEAVGDLDGDGAGDLLVGAPGGPLDPELGGRLFLVPGAGLRRVAASDRTRRPLDDPELGAIELAAGRAGDRLGASIAALPADSGGPLIAVGAPQSVRGADAEAPAGPGYALLLAPAEEAPAEVVERWTGGSGEADFGHALAWIAGPGEGPRLAVGGPLCPVGDAAETGRVWIHQPSRAEALAVLDGARPGARFGWSLAAAEDGGWLGVGAPNDSLRVEGESEAIAFRRGTLTVFELSEPKPRQRAVVYGEESRDHLGFALAPAARPGTFWAGALAWPGVAGTEEGRVYRVGVRR